MISKYQQMNMSVDIKIVKVFIEFPIRYVISEDSYSETSEGIYNRLLNHFDFHFAFTSK